MREMRLGVSLGMAGRCALPTFTKQAVGPLLRSREAMRNLLAKVWRPGNRTIEDMRCLYENDDILVVHATLSFASGSREGAMIVHHKRGGRIVRIESGVSDLSGSAAPPNAPKPDQTHADASVSGPIPATNEG
jgi:hypothetical protein